MELQELISRGRFIFRGAPKRLEVFKLINGRKSSKDIAIKTGRSLSSTLHDLQRLRDMVLVKPKLDQENQLLKKDRSTIYEKIPELRHIPLTYFSDPIKAAKKLKTKRQKKKTKQKLLTGITIPNEKQILDICKGGEDQLYEFKKAGIETRRLTKEIAAFANTKKGGIIFYGIDDDGIVSGSDLHRQELDQSLQNSVRNSISPSLTITIKDKDLLGQRVLLIFIPPWNKKDIYYYEGRAYIRKGTNVFVATPEESKRLHKGIYVV